LGKALIPLIKFPGHGTGTSSVIVARGDPTTELVGVAPEAILVPLRAVNSVIQLFDSDVAKAVNHARTNGCHVVSISLGGKGFIGLRRAIDRAVADGVIVMAACGNFIHRVTAPASYENCIAVAATGRDDAPWENSAFGDKVEVSAPGAGCFGAAWNLDTNMPFVSVKAGTSFAVAHTAGAAAMWLAHHGRENLRARYPGALLQAAFRRLLRTDAHRVPTVPGGWNPTSYGPGILDAFALLSAPLPDPAVLDSPGAFSPTPQTGAGRIAASFSTLDEAGVQARLAAAGIDDAVADATAAELLYLLMTDHPTANNFIEADPAAPGAFTPEWIDRVQSAASPVLASAMQP
jgi:hypothetical protein